MYFMTIRNFNSSVLSPRPKSKTQRRGLAVLHNAHIQRQGAAADRFRRVLEVLLLGRCLRYISRFGRHDTVSCLLLKLRIVILNFNKSNIITALLANDWVAELVGPAAVRDVGPTNFAPSRGSLEKSFLARLDSQRTRKSQYVLNE